MADNTCKLPGDNDSEIAEDHDLRATEEELSDLSGVAKFMFELEEIDDEFIVASQEHSLTLSFPTEPMPNTPQLANETEQYVSANSQLTIPAMITLLALYYLPGEAIAHLLTLDIFRSTHGAQLTIYA